MREIKFRGFEHNKMIYNPCLSDFENGSAIEINPAIRFYEGILMQYTGLKDKNGKEIYEGDIIKIPNDYDTYGQMAGEEREIIFGEGGFRLKPKWNKNARGLWLEDVEDLIIIGNIYENPGLLK